MRSQRLSPQKNFSGTSRFSVFKQNLLTVACLLLFTLLIRLPFFFRDVINWDESTFILIGQSILDGHLLYTNLWDVKPPLVFVSYALIIAVFGKSIISVRIAGALCVAFVSFCTYLVGKRLWNNRVGIISAVLVVIMASSILPDGQAVMTEHLALVPLMGVMSIFVTKRIKIPTLFLIGMLMGIASLIRLNLAYVAVLIGFFVAFALKPRSPYTILQRGLIYASGGFLVILLTYLPYVITGYQKLWVSSVILASLSYANSQLSASEILIQYLTKKNFVSSLIVILALIGICFIFFQLFKYFRLKKLEDKLGFICFFLLFAGTGISILQSGASHYHYLIQITPFVALVTAVPLSDLWQKLRPMAKKSIIALVMIIFSVLIILEYNSLLTRYLNTNKLFYGSAYKIADYLEQENATKEAIYMMEDHIVYWLINSQPLTPVSTHPSIVAKDYLFKNLLGPEASTVGEMQKILDKKPKFVVTKENIWYLRNQPEAKLLLENTLSQHYKLVEQIQGKQIYRRLN